MRFQASIDDEIMAASSEAKLMGSPPMLFLGAKRNSTSPLIILVFEDITLIILPRSEDA
jgi:hypothetical protein